MPIIEDIESWESLQKGQIAELAFERIALAHDYAVQYCGRQYTGLLEPSKYRKHGDQPDSTPWSADFVLKKRNGNAWVHHAVIEVKWRRHLNQAPSRVPTDANYLVLFTADDLMGAEVKGGKVQIFVPLHQLQNLGFREESYSKILQGTQSLLATFEDK